MKEKYANAVLIIILILALAWIAYMLAELFLPASQISAPAVNTPSAVSNAITTGTTNDGDAEIRLTPAGFSNGRFKVNIAANTHSVELGQFDLKQMTTLEYDGKTISPLSAPIMQGHHINGALIFETASEPKTFTIRIKGIPAINDRIFRW